MSLGSKIFGFIVIVATLLLCSVSFTLVSSEASAQTPPISHEIISWNDEGTATALVSIALPAAFGDPHDSLTAWVVCGAPMLCHKSPVAIEQSESTDVIGNFSMTLQTGDNPLTVTVTADDENGERISHKTQEYVAHVPEPEPLRVEFLGYEITSLTPEGKANARLSFMIVHPDEWPMRQFSTSADCNDGTRCSGQLKVWPGWFDDDLGTPRRDYTPHLVYLTMRGLEQDERVLSVVFEDADPGWRGSRRLTQLEDLQITVPESHPIEVEFLGMEVAKYNDDLTADVWIEFSMERQDDWPIPTILATFKCGGATDCEYQETLRPSWYHPSQQWSRITRILLEDVPTGEVSLSATFDAGYGRWTGPPRLTTLEDFLPAVPPQQEFDVRWRAESLSIIGHYMDGSANVDLNLVAYNFGYGGGLQDQVTSACTDVADTDKTRCHQFDPPVQVDVDNQDVLVQLPTLRLPQGESTIQIEAGAASGIASVFVPTSAVVISKDLWDCFYETQVTSGETCGGFNKPVVQKWTLETLNVYRDGDPLYIEILDSVFETISDITGIEYVIVDNPDAAQIEAYVGHQGHPRALELFGEDCAYGPGCAYHFSSSDNPNELTGAAITVGKRQPDWRDYSITLEEEIRFTTLHEALHVLIPVGHDSRPFAHSLVEKPSYMRKSDTLIYRMIYTPGVEPGMSFDELLDFVIFDEDTIDYEPQAPAPELMIREIIRNLYDAGSVKLKLTGMDVQGSVPYPGPTLDVQYAGFTGSASDKVRFSSRSWSSIIFGYDTESWSSAGGRWTMSSDHHGRARNYRGQVKFDFILADPIPLLRRSLWVGETLTLVKRGDGTFALRNTVSATTDGWPKPTVEIVLDPKSGEMRSYAIEWQFEPNSRYRYRVQAEIVSYGEEFAIPDIVREQSEYLSQFQTVADEVEEPEVQ